MKKLKTIILIVYIIGIPFAYYDAKKTYTFINTKHNHGQPKYSKADKATCIMFSLFSWASFAATQAWQYTSDWDKQEAE